MIIAITGTSSGVGKELYNVLSKEYQVIGLTRKDIDLDYPDKIDKLEQVDILINCAGHDLGGKVKFTEHRFEYWHKIMNTNLISAMRLTQLALQNNPKAMIVNVTSTNNDHFYPGDLVYSLSKKALQEFGRMIQIEFPEATIKEVRLGLTKTNFNQNRYRLKHKPIDNLYDIEHLKPKDVARQIADFIFDRDLFTRIAP